MLVYSYRRARLDKRSIEKQNIIRVQNRGNARIKLQEPRKQVADSRYLTSLLAKHAAGEGHGIQGTPRTVILQGR